MDPSRPHALKSRDVRWSGASGRLLVTCPLQDHPLGLGDGGVGLWAQNKWLMREIALKALPAFARNATPNRSGDRWNTTPDVTGLRQRALLPGAGRVRLSARRFVATERTAEALTEARVAHILQNWPALSERQPAANANA